MLAKTMRTTAVLVLVGILLTVSALCWGEVPHKTSYQGALLDDAGEPLPNESIHLVFRILDQAVGGSVLWSETHDTYTNSIGVFSVILGSEGRIDVDFSGARWLEVQLDGEVLSPRTELLGAPYSFLAEDAIKLGGLEASSYSLAEHDHDDDYVRVSEPNSVTTEMISPVVISSIDGVSNDGGDIDLVAGSNVTITPDDAGNRITISAIGGAGGGDITAVYGADGLTGSATSGDAYLSVGAGDGIDVTADAVAVDVSDFAGAGLGDDGSNNLQVESNSVTGTMIQNGAIRNVDVSSVADIAPTKILGTAWTSFNDGGGSGLDADKLDGFHSSAFSSASHNHNAVYYTETELRTSDGSAPNVGSNRVSWDNLTDVPSGFADGVDDGGTGGGSWSVTGSDVYRANGNVGIGTSSPSRTLDVQSSGSVGAYITSDYYDGQNSTHVVHAEYTGSLGNPAPVGVYAKARPADWYGIGGEFEGGFKGLVGKVYPTSDKAYFGVHGSVFNAMTIGEVYAVYGETQRGADGFGVYGYAHHADANYGVRGYATTGDYVYGIYGAANGGLHETWAGWFEGDVNATGTVSRAASGFKIDHPLDPGGMFLSHSAVESPDQKNVYDGVVVLDQEGSAWVELPDWFETLNGDFRYQLTAMGAPGPNLYIADKISSNRFRIAGGEAGMEVSWMVTGIRHDPFAETHRIVVEKRKPAHQVGKYMHPELYGMPREATIGHIEDDDLPEEERRDSSR